MVRAAKELVEGANAAVVLNAALLEKSDNLIRGTDAHKNQV